MDQQGNAPSGGGAIVPAGEVRSAQYSAAEGGGGEAFKTHTHEIGVIVPPPDIKAIADKTAQFVARNGELVFLWLVFMSHTLLLVCAALTQRTQKLIGILCSVVVF